MRQKELSFVCVLWILCAPVFAAVVPDGTSDTTVETDSLERTVVNIAPANTDRISHNRYSEFSTNDGLIVNNRTAGARTIIHEVTGATASQLAGDIRIAGTRAHMIIANPNGISVNGAEFFNTGALSLTTGVMGYQSRIDEFGDEYFNPTSSISGGTITIGPDGLSGAMNQLELLAEQIRVEGKLQNTEESAFAGTQLIAGHGSVEYNAKLSQTDPAGRWIDYTATPDMPSNAIAIDISSDALISSSRIALMVTDTGAGVRHNGQILATANSFDLTADGHVDISGDIVGLGNVDVSAASASFYSEGDIQRKTESQAGSLSLDIGSDLSVDSYLLNGAVADADTGHAGLNINLGGQLALASKNANTRGVLFSQSDVNINAGSMTNRSGRILANTGLNITADTVVNDVFLGLPDLDAEINTYTEEGKRLWYTLFLLKEKTYVKEIGFDEPDAGRVLSEIISNAGDVTITTNEFISRGGEILANDGSIAVTADTIDNQTALVGRTWLNSRCNLGGCDQTGGSTMELLGGNIKASQEVTLTATERILNDGGTIQAVGDLTLVGPDIRTVGTEVYDVLTRPGGLRDLFLKDTALWLRNDQGGALISNMGRLVIISDSALINDRGRIYSAEDIEGDIDLVAEPKEQPLTKNENIGVLEKLR